MPVSILIVDNDELTRDILFRIVGFSLPDAVIHVTAKFELACEICVKFKVNIVVTTTSIPPTSSDLMIDAVHKIGPDPIKIIIMTGESQQIKLDKIISIPNTYIVQKPINVEELLSLIKDKIAELNELERH
ncbi:response regulator [Geomonas anaerohicana]|uniref:Response regulator n=1 Tax=Geomonas anaerohicana TaxID=2798583 RepID=A0ABS0YC98_9BACT|nr:response regulator [Geomonas anaerohicana]MBJ6749901.1 response regulator [Geomonas anaerohicana]